MNGFFSRPLSTQSLEYLIETLDLCARNGEVSEASDQPNNCRRLDRPLDIRIRRLSHRDGCAFQILPLYNFSPCHSSEYGIPHTWLRGQPDIFPASLNRWIGKPDAMLCESPGEIPLQEETLCNAVS